MLRVFASLTPHLDEPCRQLPGQKVFCGFPPWRPHVIWADSRFPVAAVWLVDWTFSELGLQWETGNKYCKWNYIYIYLYQANMIKHVLKTDSWTIQISCFPGLYRGPSTISSCQGFWLARGTACTRCNFPGDLCSYLIWITRSPRAGCHLLKWWWHKLRGWKSYRLRIFQLDWLDSLAFKNCSEGETHGLCRASCQCKIHAVGSDGWAADSVAFMLFWRFTSHCDRA